MKYIRTKDGKIIDLIAYKEDGLVNGGLKFVNKINGSYFFIQQNNILKQADTIEELGDKLVCFICGDNEPYICSVRDITHLRELEQFGGKIKHNLVYDKVYVAIWTDKGLIYKAKMNDKGELELL